MPGVTVLDGKMSARAVSWRWALPQSLRDSSLTREPNSIDLKERQYSLPREGGGGVSRRRE